MPYPKHYHFPLIGVTYTDIPKNGSTSLKNYLFDLEGQMSLSRNLQATLVRGSVSHVHSRELSKIYSSKRIYSPGNEESLRILILRDPRDRVLSAWLNKILFAHGGYQYQKYVGQNFVPEEANSLGELRECYRNFVERLSRDSRFLYEDVHWVPQTGYFKDTRDYDLVLSTDELTKLPKILGMHSKFRGPKDLPPFPKLNSSWLPFTRGLETKESIELVRKTYRADLDALEESGIRLRNRIVATDSEFSKMEEGFLQTQQSIVLAQQRNRILFLESSLKAVKSSLSWRLTAPFRFLLKERR
jgi:hypothetical protein